MNKSNYAQISHYKHWIDDRVRFSDLDPLGHVNNNTVGQYFENARAALYLTVTPTWPHGDEIFVLAQSTINFLHELHMPADLRVGSGVVKIGRTSLTLSNILMHGERVISTGESVSVLINHTTRKPAPISDEFRVVLNRLLLSV
jgi:acyl-CoA thioester hydrolase